jgi:hypothetical protein
MGWTDMVQDMGPCKALVNRIMNLQVLQKIFGNSRVNAYIRRV